MSLFKSKLTTQREAIMRRIIQVANARGQCVIVAEGSGGTRVIVCGRDNLREKLLDIAGEDILQKQLYEILKECEK